MYSQLGRLVKTKVDYKWAGYTIHTAFERAGRHEQILVLQILDFITRFIFKYSKKDFISFNCVVFLILILHPKAC